MAQTDIIFIDVRCPHCSEVLYEGYEIAIAGTGADDGAICDDEGATEVECGECGKLFSVFLQCFATVRK